MLNPWSGNTPYAVEHPSLCATTAEASALQGP